MTDKVTTKIPVRREQAASTSPQVLAAIETMQRRFEGQELESAPPRQITLGDQTVTLPGTPGMAFQIPAAQQALSETSSASMPYDLPPDIGHAQATRDPTGQPLPPGALGYDQNGQPFFGFGLRGFYRGLGYRFRQAAQDVLERREKYGRVDERTGEVSPTVGGIAATTTRSARFVVTETIGLIGAELNELALLMKPLVGAATGLREAGEGSLIPQAGPAIPVSQQIESFQQETFRRSEQVEAEYPRPPAIQAVLGFGKTVFTTVTDVAQFFDNLLTTITPLAVMNNLARAVINPHNAQALSIIERNVRAAHVVYSQWIDPALREEWMREYRAGKDPELIAAQIQHPWAEALGEIVVDPTNIVGMGGRGVRAGAEALYVSEFADPAQGLAPILARLGDVTSDARAAGVTSELIDGIRAVRQGIREGRFAQKYLPSALGADGMRTRFLSRANTLLYALAGGRNADEFAEFALALARVESDDAAEAATAANTLLHHPAPGAVLSEVGQEAGILLRRALTNAEGVFDPANWLTQVRAAGGDIEKIMALANRTLARAGEELFPTVEKIVKAAAAEGATAAEKAAAAALPGWVRWVSSADAALGKGFFRPMNTFQALAYLALSPAAGMRNLMNNILTAVVDEGPRVIAFTPTDSLGQIGKWFAGIVPPGVAEAIGPKGALRGVTTRLGGLGLMERGERAVSIMVSRAAIDRTMRKVISRGLPAAEELVAAGLPEQVARMLRSVPLDDFGDLARAREIIGQFTTGGTVELWRSAAWLDAADASRLSELTLMPRVQEALRAASKEDAAKIVNEAFADLERIAGRVEDVPFAGESSPVFEYLRRFADVKNAGRDLADSQRAVQANTALLQVLGEGIDEAVEWAARTAERVGAPPEVGQRAQVLRRGFEEVVQRARSAADEIGSGIHEILVKYDGRGPFTPEEMARDWQRLGLPGDVPASRELMRDALFRSLRGLDGPGQVWREARDALYQIWTNARGVLRDAFGTEISEGLARNIDEAYHYASTVDPIPDVRAIGARFGIATATEAGAPIAGSEAHLLAAINKFMPEGSEAFARLEDVPIPVARQALANRSIVAVDEAAATLRAGMTEEQLVGAADNLTGMLANTNWAAMRKNASKIGGTPGGQIWANLDAILRPAMRQVFGSDEAAIRFLDELGILELGGARPVAPYVDGLPNLPRVLHESAEGIGELKGRLLAGLNQNWGRTEEIVTNPQLAEAGGRFLKRAEEVIATARVKAAAIAKHARDFALHAYGEKSFIDHGLAYGYPWHFWYGRTYMNWMKRLVYAPEVMTAYAKYRKAVEAEHSDMPDWWQQQVNVSELLGLEMDNPLFFNLEASLNPINALTGVDFDDPYKRPTWWTAVLQEAGMYGPAPYSFINWITATALYAQGENEAAARWGGRLIPATGSLVRPLTTLLGKPVEVDPFIHLFSGGIDPYERRRIGRQAPNLLARGYSQEEIIDAFRAQEGPLWDEALLMANQERAPGTLASYFLGIGFKPRTAADMTVDQFFEEYNRIWEIEPTLSSEELQDSLDALRERYPFMDALLLSRKGGVERDRSYAYNVLSRIPPGQRDDFARAIGLDYSYIERFYDGKGHLEEWNEADQQTFMGAMLRLGAALAIPADATREEWRQASRAMQRVYEEGELRFGPSIWDRVDVYLGQKGDSPEERELAEEILRADPAIEAALNMKASLVQADPILAAYYGGLQQLEGYYRGLAFQRIEDELGPEIWDTMAQYWDVSMTSADRRRFKSLHPEVDRYYDIRNTYEPLAARAIVDLADQIAEAIPAEFRQGAPEEIQEAGVREDLLAIPWSGWQTILGSGLSNIIADYIYEGERIPSVAYDRLQETAARFEVDDSTLLEILQRALSEGALTP